MPQESFVCAFEQSEFRDAKNQLVDVGDVKMEANMNMPGMQMHEGATIQRSGTPGQYRAKIKPGMAGDWTANFPMKVRAAADKPASISTLNNEDVE